MSKSYYSLGLMSGTSMDGVDASIIQSDGETKYKVIIDKYFRYPQGIYKNLIKLRDKIRSSKDLKKFSKEVKNVENARKSIIASSKINKGETFTHENLSVKRPGSGISPIYYWDLLGMQAERDYETDDLIEQ